MLKCCYATKPEKKARLPQLGYVVTSITHEIILRMDFLDTYKAGLQVSQKKIRLKNPGITTVHILYLTGCNQSLASARIVAHIEILAQTDIKLLIEAELIKSTAGLLQKISLFSSKEMVFNKPKVLMPFAITLLKNKQAVITIVNPTMNSVRLHKGMSEGYLSDIDTDDIHCFVQQPNKVTLGGHATVASIKMQDKVTLPHFMHDINMGEEEASKQDIGYLKIVLLTKTLMHLPKTNKILRGPLSHNIH